MDLLQLKYFKDAACYENFSKAAMINRVPQSSISRTIKALEDEYNTPLFDRIGRNVYLNDNGRFLYEQTCNIFDSLDACADRFDKNREHHIIVYIQNAGLFVPIISTDFMVCHPDTHITFSTASEVLHSTRSPYDLTFIRKTENMEEYEYEPLFSDELVLLVSKEHPLAQYDEVDVSALKDELFVSFYNTICFRQLTNQVCEEFGGFTPPVIFETHDELSIIHLVAKNYGVTLFPEKQYLLHANSNIKTVKLKQTLADEIVLAWNRNAKLTITEKKYIEYCKNWFKEELPKLLEK